MLYYLFICSIAFCHIGCFPAQSDPHSETLKSTVKTELNQMDSHLQTTIKDTVHRRKKAVNEEENSPEEDLTNKDIGIEESELDFDEEDNTDFIEIKNNLDTNQVESDDVQLDNLNVSKPFDSSLLRNETYDSTLIPEMNNEEELIVSNDHSIWQELLSTYVTKKGVVNYAGFKKDVSRLEEYLAILQDWKVNKSDNSNEAMAYWINAYNAFTIKLILDHYPISSIRDVYNGNPWDENWIKLGTENYSLNEIEHSILRKTWKDPRIHFAVNCAAQSCPPLSNIAFDSSNLDQQLNSLTQTFINNSLYNRLSEGQLELSKIFEWYKDDFGQLTSFINKFANIQVQEKAQITFLDYDWSLNGI